MRYSTSPVLQLLGYLGRHDLMLSNLDIVACAFLVIVSSFLGYHHAHL